MQFTNALSEHLVTMSAGPTLTILCCSLLAAGLTAFALYRARDAWLLGGTVGLMAAAGSALAVLGLGDDARSVAHALRHVVRIDAIASAAGAFALSAGFVTFLSVMSVRSRVLPSLLAITVGAISALTASIDAAHLRSLGELPTLDNPNCRRVHVDFAGGAPCVPSTVAPDGWRLSISPIDASSLGDTTFEVLATRGRVRVERSHQVRVGAPTPAAAFAPSVGDRFTYARRAGGGALLLFVIPLQGSTEDAGAELVATANVIIDGKEAVVVERHGFDPLDTRLHNARFFVASVDGTAYVLESNAVRWSPLIVQRDVSAGQPTELEVSDDLFAHPCSVEVFPGAACWCVERAAPVRCHYAPTTEEKVGSVLVAIFTIGLVIPSSDGVNYELTSAGPDAGSRVSLEPRSR